MEDSIDEKCLYSSFNQDSSLFCVGTNKGFRVYSSYPFKCVGKRDISGGIGIVEILNRCNIFALVGTGDNPKFGQNKVVLWDELKFWFILGSWNSWCLNYIYYI